MELQGFLASKPLYYKEIDHERVHIAYALLKPHIKRPPTVHLVGTNGKGSTGRMVAHLAQKSGLLVGHYSSPHILKFNERIWLDGFDVSDALLEMAHQELFSLLGERISDSLSYFEYTTLLAFVVFQNCDLMVLEAGLGGEFDATNVCDKELSILTPIGLDHQAFLGETIEEIATTKINSIQKKVLIAPQIYDEVLEIAKDICQEKNAELFTVGVGLVPTLDVENSKGRHETYPYGWADYLISNAQVAMRALDILDISYDINYLKTLELFGRFYPLTPNIRIDVGHNPLASQAIVKALDAPVVLIYNSLDDKDYEEVLRILKPKIKRVEIIAIESQRATTREEIEKALDKLEIKYSDFEGKIEEEEKYLVFGSFYVVEAFLKSKEKTLQICS
ncbi:MAG: Mur ligase family protein [Sulfurovum sp.]|nr:Mur ligase family protein [Sulfurovum sp.]